ncbi:ABC transporter permease [Streptococcus caprae]|uniref:Transport permease protein n=1 Tax=Streptococcus caprae TaxID=1640501 RepID=A0ABV8CXN6_9STRE|nr:ABC transporter permease [Streptococcus suis]RRR54946.1 ABC transporter permease [Streptococcus suis]
MSKISIKSIRNVIIRNYMSFRNLFKISIMPNLVDPLFYLIAMGFGVGSYLTMVGGMSYRDFIITGLISATAMTAATSETTVNAFIQFRLEKTYDAMLMTPINTGDIVIGQSIWAGIRAVIFGGIFFLVSIFISGNFHISFLLIPVVLFIVGYLFGILGLSFTYLAPSREFLNYYNVLVIRPLYMFSDTFFPISSMPLIVQKITWLSPLYHASKIVRGIWINEFKNLFPHFIWLITVSVLLSLIPMYILNRSYFKS